MLHVVDGGDRKEKAEHITAFCNSQVKSIVRMDRRPCEWAGNVSNNSYSWFYFCVVQCRMCSNDGTGTSLHLSNMLRLSWPWTENYVDLKWRLSTNVSLSADLSSVLWGAESKACVENYLSCLGPKTCLRTWFENQQVSKFGGRGAAGQTETPGTSSINHTGAVLGLIYLFCVIFRCFKEDGLYLSWF